jgi:hypothetical protein
MARRLRREFGGGTHARGRSAAADGQLRRLGARLDDVRRRRHHERQHATFHFLELAPNKLLL